VKSAHIYWVSVELKQLTHKCSGKHLTKAESTFANLSFSSQNLTIALFTKSSFLLGTE
jgi:hypothetical protein